MFRRRQGSAAPLRSGDVVQIRSREEILATLDARGRLDGLPFMPEMLKFCGQPAVVHKRAERLCDTIDYGPQRRMRDTVLLVGLRCDGEAHGGCQAGCMLFWNERWLRRLPDSAGTDADHAEGTRRGRPAVPAISVQDLAVAARPALTDGSSTNRFMCQATEVSRASTPMPWWEPAQYVRDVTSGNASPVQVYVGLIKWLFIRIQKRLVNGSKVPFVKGRLTKTPRELLGLQPGELVRVKSKEEIALTLDRDNRNRGLSFDAEMLRYCGKEFHVLRRVERIIDEQAGNLASMRGDCIILDDVVCTSEYHRLCPRRIYPYWREIWLTRVDQPVETKARAAPTGSTVDTAAPARQA